MVNNKSPKLSRAFFAKCSQEITDLGTIKRYLVEGADLNFQSEDDGYTALMLAVDKDDESLVMFLLNQGANPLIKNYYEEIASDIALCYSPIYQLLKNYELLFASLINDIDMAKSAIFSGANINFQGIGGYTALMIAMEQNHFELVDFLNLQL